MGQNMGQKCGLATGQSNRQLPPPNLDLRHIQDHFGFTFPRVALTHFSEDFSPPVFKPSAGIGRFSASAGNLLPRFQHGSKTWVRLSSLNLEQDLHPTPRCRDCSITFKNCKSFLYKRNYRRIVPNDTTRRFLTIRSNQLNLYQNCSTSCCTKTRFLYFREKGGESPHRSVDQGLSTSPDQFLRFLLNISDGF